MCVYIYIYIYIYIYVYIHVCIRTCIKCRERVCFLSRGQIWYWEPSRPIDDWRIWIQDFDSVGFSIVIGKFIGPQGISQKSKAPLLDQQLSSPKLNAVEKIDFGTDMRHEAILVELLAITPDSREDFTRWESHGRQIPGPFIRRKNVLLETDIGLPDPYIVDKAVGGATEIVAASSSSGGMAADGSPMALPTTTARSPPRRVARTDECSRGRHDDYQTVSFWMPFRSHTHTHTHTHTHARTYVEPNARYLIGQSAIYHQCIHGEVYVLSYLWARYKL